MDAQLHSTLYSIIRSGSVDSLNDWFKMTRMEPQVIYRLLGTAYEELHLKNVPIPREMQFEIEWRLVEFQFVTKNYQPPKDVFKTFREIKQHLDLTCEFIKTFRGKYDGKESIHSLSFINDAKLLTLHISTLKRRSNHTYKKIPWEEMEFCLILLVLIITKSQEVELTYELVLQEERVLEHLKHFFNELTELQEWFNEVELKELKSDGEQLKAIQNKLDKLKIGTQKGRLQCNEIILNNSKQFGDLYKDFFILRDIYSLNRMKHYLEIAIAADLDADPTVGCLVIQRALQVIGEYLKNEIESANISENLYQVLIKLVATNLKDTCASLRNMLSHLQTFNKRLELEATNDNNIFRNIQVELKTINAEITRVLYKRKIDALKVFLENLLKCSNKEEMQKLFRHVSINKLEEGTAVEVPSLSHVKDLILLFWEQIKDDINDDNCIDEVMSEVNSYEARLSQISSNYKRAIKALRQISKSEQFKATKNFALSYLGLLNTSDLKGIFEEGIFGSLHIIYNRFKLTRCTDVNDTSSTDQKLIEVTKILTKIHNILKWELQSIKWLEEMNSELESHEISTTFWEKQLAELFKEVKKQLNADEGDEFDESIRKANVRPSSKNKLLDALLNDTEGEEFKSILTSMKPGNDIEARIVNSYRKKKLGKAKEQINGCIPDAYGSLLKQLILLKDIFQLDSYFGHLKKFYSALALDKILIKKINNLTKNLTLQDIQKNYCKRLSTLNEVYSSIGTTKTMDVSPSIISALEMLVLDLTEYLEKMDSLGGNQTFLIEKLSILNGKQLRNHLAHGSIITKILPYNTNVPLLFYSQNLLNLDDEIKTEKSVWTVGFKFTIDDETISSYISRCQSIVKSQDALFRAVEEGNFDKVQLLIKAGADIYAKDVNGWSLLDVAVKSNNKECIAYLVANGIQDCHLFQLASPYVVLSSFDTFTYFLENTSKLDIHFIFTENQKSLLHIAAEVGQLEIAVFLLENMKETNIITTLDETPLHLACKNGFLEIALLLLDHHADFINKQTLAGATALHMAAENGHCNIAIALIDKDADLSLKRHDSFSAFELAIRNGHVDVVNMFLGLHENPISPEEMTEGFLLACQYGQCTIANTLLLKQTNISARINDAAYMATVFGHADVLAILIYNGANLNWKHKNDNSLLHIASQFGHLEVANILLKHNAEVNARNKAMWTPLHFAFQYCNLEIIDLLRSWGGLESLHDINGLTPFHIAAENGHIDSVERFLQIPNANINLQTTKNGWTALHLAAGQGQIGVVNLLVAKGAALNMQAPDGSTALHWAIQRHGYVDVVNALIQHEAKLNLQDIHGATPLHTAVLNQNEDILKILLKHGADVKIPNKTSYTPLHIAAMNWNANIVQLLLAKIDDVNIRGHLLETPLHLAATHGSADIVRLLLEKGANCNLLNKNDVSALHLAAYNGHLDIVKLLLLNKAEINGHDNIGRSPLFMALIQGNEDIAMFLIENGANVRERINDCVSMLSYSISKGMADVVSAIIQGGINVNDEYGLNRTTPLIMALLNDREAIALLLLEHEEIDVHASTTTKWTALHAACGKGFRSCVEKILTFHPDVNARTEKLTTPLYFAAEKGNHDIVEILLANGAAVDGRTNLDLPTPLSCAVRNGHKDVIATLIEHNADVNVRCKTGMTPLHIAIFVGNTEVAKIILGCSRTSIEATTDNQWNALHFAAHKGNFEIMALLLERDVSTVIDATTEPTGDTALHLAARNGYKEIVAMLIENNADVTVKNLDGLTAKDIAETNGFSDIIKLFS